MHIRIHACTNIACKAPRITSSYPLPSNDILSGQNSASPSNQKTLRHTLHRGETRAHAHCRTPPCPHMHISTAYPPKAAYTNIQRQTLSHSVSNARLGLATAHQTAHAPSDTVYQSRLRSTQRKALVLTLHLHQSASMRICIQASHQTPSRVTLPITTSTRPLAV